MKITNPIFSAIPIPRLRTRNMKRGSNKMLNYVFWSFKYHKRNVLSKEQNAIGKDMQGFKKRERLKVTVLPKLNDRPIPVWGTNSLST